MSGSKDDEKVMIKNGSLGVSEEAEVKVATPFYRKRSCQICCGVTTTIVLLLVILIIILSFTVFKPKDPRITVTGMSLQSFSANMDGSLRNFELDVSLLLNVSVNNPNVASFKYENSSTSLFYRGREVGSAAIPAGKVDAKKTERFTTSLRIHALDIPFDANVTGDLQTGIIPVTTYASIRGKLNVLNIFKRNAVSTSDCSANIFIANTTLKDFECSYSLKL